VRGSSDHFRPGQRDPDRLDAGKEVAEVEGPVHREEVDSCRQRTAVVASLEVVLHFLRPVQHSASDAGDPSGPMLRQ